jgi:Tol biopolymer transport system component/tRNA A-37 threonylcarbamoyl transferase component Bud32
MTLQKEPHDESTISNPAPGEGLSPAAGEEQDDLVGRQIGSYRIRARLGSGGMGIVYRAEHLKLRKTVALKFLRRDVLADEASRQRFIKEARAAAALDHSSICAVYDFDDSQERSYISMAYIDGPSLRKRIAAGTMLFGEAVLVAIQVAEGLAEAHRAGILHRDIKPSNILLSAAGRAKIVDFGLALVGGTARITSRGRIVGTVAYMSPEQASGREVDHRTDIWSLGVVLYEMVAGRPPFIAERPDALFHLLLHQDPPSLAELRPGTPPELCWIIQRCLAKNPDERYEDCEALLRDLRDLMTRLADRRRTRPSWVLKNRGRLLIGGLSVLALSTAIILAVAFPPWRGDADLLRGASPLQVTSDKAWEGDPALSPDGSRIAYAKRVAGNTDLFVINATGGEPLRLTVDAATDREPCWLPDGSAILFASDRLGEFGVWRVDPQGGTPNLLLADARDPAVSPDGEKLACGRIATGGELRIALVSLAGSPEPRFLTASDDGPGQHRHPAWSPDGTTICYATQRDLWTVQLDGAPARPLTSGGLADDRPCWSTNGRWIYFDSLRGNSLALWRVGTGGGQAVRLTLGSSGECGPSLSRDGHRLAYALDSGEKNEDVVIADRRTGQEHRLSGEAHDCFQPSLSADGSLLVFVSDRQEGRYELWLQELTEGQPDGEPRRLTIQPGNACHPAVSADGQWVAYYRYVGDTRDLWVISTRGGTPNRITADAVDDWHAAWSPDGRRLAFASERGEGGRSIWMVEIANGQPAGEFHRLTPPRLPALFPAWSPDGNQIAFLGHSGGHNYVYLVPSDGSEPPRRIETVVDAKRARWVAATSELWVCAQWTDGPLSIRAIAPDLSTAVELDPPLIFHPFLENGLFDVSGDGQLVVYSYPERTGDIWLLERQGGAF